MAKRKRDIQLKFRVTPQEREMIETKMAQFGTTNMAAYLRKMAIDGYVTYEINPDGTCQTQDYYQDLTGTGPTQYYVESNSSLKKYMYIDAYPAWGFRTELYLLRGDSVTQLMHIENRQYTVGLQLIYCRFSMLIYGLPVTALHSRNP